MVRMGHAIWWCSMPMSTVFTNSFKNWWRQLSSGVRGIIAEKNYCSCLLGPCDLVSGWNRNTQEYTKNFPYIFYICSWPHWIASICMDLSLVESMVKKNRNCLSIAVLDHPDMQSLNDCKFLFVCSCYDCNLKNPGPCNTPWEGIFKKFPIVYKKP